MDFDGHLINGFSHTIDISYDPDPTTGTGL